MLFYFEHEQVTPIKLVNIAQTRNAGEATLHILLKELVYTSKIWRF